MHLFIALGIVSYFTITSYIEGAFYVGRRGYFVGQEESTLFFWLIFLVNVCVMTLLIALVFSPRPKNIHDT